ncbi:hypothetical protein RND61_12485 [Streptomyces sp. TRM76323]|uniref:Lipoprotein n=1 Tax=Streptomyces tamarix TaxID=3078565 RepID=A0ABU3QJC5_9ACTN|nr:hypothetical protein [Streptomyces tamarix]MDT9682883.1 hypothetical protein [Streptomyces tamarix]
MNTSTTSPKPARRARPAGRRHKGLLAALTVLVVAGAFASATPARAATYPLDCLITGGPAYTGCSGKLTVHPGQRLDVDLVSSGGKQVRFCAEPFGGGIDFECSGWLNPGAHTATVWRNGTGQTKYVQLIAGKRATVHVHAQGRYHIH